MLVERGLVVLSSRRHEKLIQDMTVKENLTLTSLGRYWKGGWFRAIQRTERGKGPRAPIRREVRERREADSHIEWREPAKGRRRSVIAEPSAVLALDEPTQGVDVGGKADIIALAEAGGRTGHRRARLQQRSRRTREPVQRGSLSSGRDGLVSELEGEDINQERILSDCYGS